MQIKITELPNYKFIARVPLYGQFINSKTNNIKDFMKELKSKYPKAEFVITGQTEIKKQEDPCTRLISIAEQFMFEKDVRGELTVAAKADIECVIKKAKTLNKHAAQLASLLKDVKLKIEYARLHKGKWFGDIYKEINKLLK